MNLVHVLSDLPSLAQAASRFLLQRLQPAGKQGQPFRLALSGGKTPRAMFTRLGQMREAEWSRLHVFWADERCVPPDHPESNYRLAWELWLSKIALEPGQIHRIPAEHGPSAAAAYEAELLDTFGLTKGERPRFDLIVLGVGKDGHTASLFPGSDALQEKEQLVVATMAPVEPKCRISLTLPVLRSARTVLFLVSGTGKAGILRSILRDENPNLPASLVKAHASEVHWFLDRQAYRALLD